MILAAAHAGAYRAVEPPQRGADPEPVAHRHAAVTALDRLRSEGWVARRMTHRLPGSTAVALRISHRGHGIRRTPRRAPMTATAPHKKPPSQEKVGRGVEGHGNTPPLRLGRVMGNLHTHSSSLMMPFTTG